MTDIKRIDIAEFRRLGYLQEANRLFFHPHGLALEVTRVAGSAAEDEADGYMSNRVVAELCEAIRQSSFAPPAEGHEGVVDGDKIHAMAVELADLLYPVGSERLSGVWDYRDDPEGVLYGDLDMKDAERAETVREERLRHVKHRAQLFGRPSSPEPAAVALDLDVEPLGYKYEEPE